MFSKLKAIVKLLRIGHSSQKLIPSSSIEQINLNSKPIHESIIITEQRSEMNEEDVTIVWLSKDAKNTKEQSLMGSLRSINDYIQVRSLSRLLFLHCQ
jgi:hypothetical protein